jgi:hypothetical protein
MLQYLPWLKAAGFEMTVAPLFSDEYVLGFRRGYNNNDSKFMMS